MDSDSKPDVPNLDFGRVLSVLGSSVLVIVLLGAVIGGALAWEPVDAGHVKVVKTWGEPVNTFSPGAHFIVPVMQSTIPMSTRAQAYTMSSQQGEGDRSTANDAITVLTEDGLRVDIDLTVRYRLDPTKAIQVHNQYRDLPIVQSRLIRPSIRSVLRTEAGRLSVTEIYTGEGQTKLKRAAEEELGNEWEEEGIILETVQVRNVNLPDQYEQAIEDKEVTNQRRQQKQNELEVEKLEAQRLKIEAEGQAEANQIIAESLRDNPELIQIRYIEALKQDDNTIYFSSGPNDIMMTKNVENSTSA